MKITRSSSLLTLEGGEGKVGWCLHFGVKKAPLFGHDWSVQTDSLLRIAAGPFFIIDIFKEEDA
jgi:hypothetical protein